MQYGNNFQVTQNAQFLVCPSKSVRPEQAYGLYRTGRKTGQVARLIGVGLNETADLIFEGQQIQFQHDLCALIVAIAQEEAFENGMRAERARRRLLPPVGRAA